MGIGCADFCFCFIAIIKSEREKARESRASRGAIADALNKMSGSKPKVASRFIERNNI